MIMKKSKCVFWYCIINSIVLFKYEILIKLKKKNTLYDNLKTCINKKDLLKPDKVKFVKQNKKWLLIDFW